MPLDRGTILYIAFVGAAAAVAIAERAWALRNERRLVRAGAEEVAPWVFRLMAPIYVLLFPAAVLERLLLDRRPEAWLAIAMAVLFLLAKALKLWAVVHLRDAWTMKVIVPASLRVVASGPYRYLRHPNYVAVIGEILALPLAGGAWATALLGGIAFGAILACRVKTEEAALMRRPEYAAAMARRGRFLPVVLLLVLHAAQAAAPAPGAGPVTLEIRPNESSLEFTVSRPGEVVEGKAPDYSGEVVFDPDRPSENASVVLRVAAASMVTGNRLRDRKMRGSHLEADRFPEIVFRSTSVALAAEPGTGRGAGLRPGEERRGEVLGVLALHGVERPIRFPVAIRYDGAALTAEGSLSLKLTDHQIPIPRFFWIVLDDEVKVRFRLVARAAQAPPADQGTGE